MSLRLHWVRPVQDLIKGIGFGYSASSASLGLAVERGGAELADDAMVAVHFDYPMSFQPIEGRRNLLFTMYETRPLPPAFFPFLAQADAVFVPSRFCFDLFRPHVPKRTPMRISPLGYDPAIFYPPLRRREFDMDSWEPGKPRFRFFWNGSASQRKGWMQTTGAWSWVFQQLPWCELLLKTTDENSDGTVTHVSSNTVADTRTLPWHELAELYRTAHCFVLPSLGEGWGLTPLEAMACACPTIVCKFGGVLEYANARTAYFCDFDFHTDDTPLGPAEGSYTSPAKLAKAMRNVAFNYPAALEQGERAAAYVRKRFTWERAAAAFVANLDSIGWCA